MNDGVTIRAMRAGDLDEADRIFRLAFGTFLGLSGQRWVGSSDNTTLFTLYDPGIVLICQQFYATRVKKRPSTDTLTIYSIRFANKASDARVRPP